MGAATSQSGKSDLKVDRATGFKHNTEQEKQISQPKILVSINNDNTVRISEGISIATQTPRDGYGSNATEQTAEVKCGEKPKELEAVVEERHDRSVQTDIITEECLTEERLSRVDNGEVKISPIPAEKEAIAESVTSEKENKNISMHIYARESENEAGETDYSTDIALQTDDDFDFESLDRRLAWGSKSVDSAKSLQQNLKETNNKEEKEADTQTECDTPTPARPFEQLSLERYGKYKVRLSSDNEKCIISSATFLDTGDAVVIDRSNQKVKFVDKEFQFISSYDLPAKPWAVCARGIDVYVTMGNTKIQHLTIEEMIIEPVEVFEIKGRCLGICVFGEHLAIGLQVGEVCLLDFNGKKQGTIKLPTFNGKSCNPWHLTVTSENNILVTDSDAGALYCLNNKSELLFTFKGSGSPRGTAIDSEGNTLVAGRDKETGAVVTMIHRDEELNHMLHIDHQTEFRSRILSTWEQLEFVPYCICYRNDRVVILGGIQESLKIMKIV